MESSPASYLHKKFKKQLSVEPTRALLLAAQQQQQPYGGEVADSEEARGGPKENRRDHAGECNNGNSGNSGGHGRSAATAAAATDNQTRPRDNNDASVPNQSTKNNQSSSFALSGSTSSISTSKSSISSTACCTAANLQSANSCISSYVVSSNYASFSRPTLAAAAATTTTGTSSFDGGCGNAAFSIKPEPEGPATTSSILHSFYSSNRPVFAARVYEGGGTDIPSASSVNIGANSGGGVRLSPEKEQPGPFQEAALQEETQPPPDKNGNGGGGGKYVCPYCNLVCSKPSVLQKHIRAHTNERPFPCNSCGFSFKTRSNLYKHCRSRTHANRVMGNKAQAQPEPNGGDSVSDEPRSPPSMPNNSSEAAQAKPYKPRFHTAKLLKENNQQELLQQQQQQQYSQEKAASEEAMLHASSDLLSHHINEIISKNNSIVNSSDPYLLKKHRSSVDGVDHVEYVQQQRGGYMAAADEPLNLTNKNRKRCMSEVVEPVAQKSIIKQLLLKNLSSDMQCPHCKMIFQTVTELELHKLRSCKGFVKPGAKYTRSSSVNVASILTQNKNAFDNIPHLQNAAFPLKSPGPFLGKTRLVESDKSKSFSFDDGMPAAFAMQPSSDRYLSLSPLTLQSDKEKKAVPVKLFGGEVKITHSSGETKSFRIENKDQGDAHFAEYGVKMSENRVVKSQLQSGGTVLTNTNKANYGGGLQDSCLGHEVMRGYDEAPGSPGIDVVGLGQGHKSRFDRLPADGELSQLMRTPQQSQQLDISGGFSSAASPSYKYANIMDFSQKSVKLLTPNLKQPVPAANRFTFGAAAAAALSPIPPDSMGKPNLNLAAKDNPGRRESSSSPYSPGLGKFFPHQQQQTTTTSTPTPSITTVAKIVTPQSPNLYNPMNLLVNGKVVRYVPGIPGPVAAEEPMDVAYVANNNIRSGIVSITAAVRKNGEDRDPGTPKPVFLQPPPEKPPKAEKAVEGVRSKEVSSSTTNEIKPPPSIIVPAEPKKFARPNSLALKPTTASLKQHHGLTPTMFNQILISPDTPRVAKKYVQQFLHGNYFSYLGLKCSTKPVYCTLNKTQPFYVPHFKKLSMYSEWRQQDTRQDRLYVSAYDSRQRQPRYTTAGRAAADLIVHSSYKFVATESHSAKGEKGEDQQKGSTILGGYECNDDYTYIRGRGRGRYVCDQCGIRCKKPSMLKKHIRTHSNDRPYTCNHCNFSFKTKGNLTKHMKSKAHTKNYVAGGSSSSSTQQSGTQSSESDTDESGMESSDESTRREEHEAAYGLLSLAQKSSAVSVGSDLPGGNGRRRGAHSPSATAAASSGMNSEEIAYVFKSNYARNKILDDGRSLGGGGTGGGGNPKSFSEMMIAATVTVTSASGEEAEEVRREAQNMLRFLGRRSAKRPLTYPYTSALTDDAGEDGPNGGGGSEQNGGGGGESNPGEPKSIKQFHVIQKYAANALSPKSKSGSATTAVLTNNAMKTEGLTRGGKAADAPPNPKVSPQPAVLLVPVPAAPPPAPPAPNSNTNNMQPPVLKVNDVVFDNISHRGHHHAQDARKRKLSISGSGPEDLDYTSGVSKMAKINEGVMDLSMANAVPDLPRTADRVVDSGVEVLRFNDESSAGGSTTDEEIIVDVYSPQAHYSEQDAPAVLPVREYDKESVYKSSEFNGKAHAPKNNGNVLVLGPAPPQNEVNVNFVMAGGPASDQPRVSDEASSDRQLQQQQPQPPPPPALSSYQSSLEQQYDNSAMETLADIATKQVKLEKNTLAKSVASEFLKLATKNEYHPPGEAPRDPSAFSLQSSKDVSDLMTKSEGSKSCNICLKSFSKPSQLRIHMNIHYMERPFRCHSCSVSFRTKGHLQKHERSASHHNKLSSSPALSSSEPRPFKCVDCSIAFRIHGHLAKHLRSKMHIMKLECLAKIPFGLYAELERSNSLLTEINTADGDQCLESLKTLAKKVFLNDPNKLNQASLAAELALDADS